MCTLCDALRRWCARVWGTRRARSPAGGPCTARCTIGGAQPPKGAHYIPCNYGVTNRDCPVWPITSCLEP
eukprot:74627-Chlamydomonas_euryale.AAC.10